MPRRHLVRPIAGLGVLVLVAACGGMPTATGGPPSATALASPVASSSAVAPSAAASIAAAAPSAMLGPTTGALTLVEPLRDVSAAVGSVALTPAGSLVATEAGADQSLHALDCAASCGDPATWTDTLLDPGVAWANPVVRARDDGSLVAVADGRAAGQPTEAIGTCASGCDKPASWHWALIPLPAGSSGQRDPSRDVAVGGDAMVIGLGSGSPMSALVCGGTCDHPASWARIVLSAGACTAPSVAASPAGAMAIACATRSTASATAESVDVWSCPGQCTNQINWGGVSGVASGSGLAVDVTVGPGGSVNAAVDLGTQANTAMSHHLGWFQRLGGCATPASWHGIEVGTETLYGHRLAAATDGQGRSVVAYDGTSSAGSGLLAAVCTAGCLKAASWSVVLLDDATRLSAQIAVTAPPGCTTVAWVPASITDIALRGAWAAIASGYDAVGSGGSCAADPHTPGAGFQPIRSVVSLAVLGP